MGKHILFALLTGLLVLGMSNAFAEEPQLSDQEILKAWGSAQVEATKIVEAPAHMAGVQVLTDENLDDINAAGRRDLPSGAHGLIAKTNGNKCGVACVTFPLRKGGTGCAGIICKTTVNGADGKTGQLNFKHRGGHSRQYTGSKGW